MGLWLLVLVLALMHSCIECSGPSFAGSNLYYAPGLSSSTRQYYLKNLQSAGVKVLRLWLDGQSTATTKGTTIYSYPDLEPYQVGVFDDTVLRLVDDFMIDAHAYGIKLIISMHSFNALAAGDVYGQRWGTGYFYEQQDAMDAFDNRLRHIVTHTHHTLGKQWKDLSDYIFGFEAENEAMIGKGAQYISDHQYWQCDRARTIRQAIGSSHILVMTGGESWLDESMQNDWFYCSYLDVLSIHAYGPGDYDTNKLMAYVQKAWNTGKKLLMQEWGACYYNTPNNNCPVGTPLSASTRAANLKAWSDSISKAGIPWLYWEVLPNNDPHYSYDYEIGINDQNWDTFVQIANGTKNYGCNFDYGTYLL